MDENDDLLRMIRDSANAVGTRGDLTRVRSLRFAAPGFDRAMWRQMAELGWVGLLVPEEKGGLGLGVEALAAIAEELGARLVAEPLIETAVVAGLLDGDDLAALLAGERLILPAWQDRANILVPDDAMTIAEGAATGSRRFILGGEGADGFLLLTGSQGALIRADAPGVEIETEATQDGGRFATLRLDRAAATAVALTEARIGEALDVGALATAAYLTGLSEQAFEMTLDYLRTREQFGKVIGTFQALQHRAADLSVQIALSRASVADAVRILAGGANADDCARAVSRAKARAAETAMLVTRQAIQLHGGIGFTDEHDIGLFLRRAMVLANAYGSATVHRQRYGALLGAALSDAA
ncbi:MULTISPECIES: acyl-CoA dehydrogenase family protein [unclassified Sphingobium]|uniref:acyl-CoA dehydrogenase family protein n=1 Tax=unclassified Sphingobium TaxID=2611147 RepID=UPI000D168D69|nr:MULTISPECIES: acyl-CoA dehydrogenase family protein [unclassified Sphingobium]MBG6120063.1 alkylation response protein AidB-like acyl-CoA dehydrogenase [Sphingobium sp. JAI105]PSO12883.1 acyl-CoA dehydrogenase [Sphingobium sp. AEW4]TWD05736.1 alkylation response protein AidB-like acyl-CoA dehydrogenase [Sphingobium sp. AEW010]TWD23289.1 alkylation response protein AidB-like acyl-CoA dehydrogenase [Sphingobium sp. AEW013]TWD25149.1 alkylation response protein AidB-like acyl-CoA dehydrogenase